jgi:hypothetical protein
MVFNKKLAGRIYPRHSRLVQALNENPLFLAWAEKHEGCRSFSDRNGTAHLRGFYEHINGLMAGSAGAIDYLEFGVAQGRSLRLWAGINGHRRSRFYGFDSFYGLPEDWEWAIGGMPRGAFSTGGRKPALADRRVRCVSGLFQESLPPFLGRYRPGNPLIVHLDADLYTSTLFCLTRLDPLLDGAAVIFDQFDNLLHEFAAFRHYTESHRRTCTVLARVGYFKKAAIVFGGRY